MTTQIQRRRGTTAQHSTFTGAVGEVTVDTDKEVLVVHDGAQVGGYPQMRENGSNSALSLGSAATPSLKFSGDPNTGIYSPGADQVAISTGGSPRVTVTSTGVGVGTTSPSSLLEISSSSTPQFLISNTSNSISAGSSIGTIDYRAGSSNTVVARMAAVADSANEDGAHIVFENRTGGGAFSERARIDSSGRLLVGTSSARSNYFNSTGSAQLQIEGTVLSNSAISTTRNSNDVFGSAVVLNKSRGTTVGSNSLVSLDDELGRVIFEGNDGTEFVIGATIEAFVDGTSGANDMPGRLVFSTNPGAPATAPTERMRITSTGQVRLAGAGITFNGDTATANELDDYEEGTFTPALSATGATFGYNTNTGRYTKIGNSVTVHGRIILSSRSGGSGTVTLTGLPFAGAPAIVGNNIGQQGIIGRSSGFAGDVPDSLEIKEGDTYASIYYRASANAATSLLDYSDLGSTTNFLFTLTYRTTN